MLRSVSGYHVEKVTTDDARAIFKRRAGSLKICNEPYTDLVAQFHEVNPHSPVCCRWIQDAGGLDDMRYNTQRTIDKFITLRHVLPPELLYLEIWPNEKFQAGEELSKLSHNTVDCAKMIADAGARPVGFNISVANPSMDDVPRCIEGAEALIANNGAFGYHNYTTPDKQLNQDLDLRHEKMAPLLPPDLKWWLNEGLYDHGIGTIILYGWRWAQWNLSPNQVGSYVLKIAERLAKDFRVLGWTPFGAGPSQEWIDKGFQYDNESEIYLPLSEEFYVPYIGEGFKRMIPYLGNPLEDEVYHFPGTPMESSLAVFENGTANWYKVSNETIAQRSDGAIFTDRGNHGDGKVILVWTP